MKTLRTIPLAALLLIIVGCAGTLDPGQDRTIVNAESTITNARNTFALVTKTEYETYPALKATNPTVAAEVRTFVNYLRLNQQRWLQSATNLKNVYAESKTDANKTKMDTALAVLTQAVAEATRYMAMMNQTNAWLSYKLAAHIGERK